MGTVVLSTKISKASNKVFSYGVEDFVQIALSLKIHNTCVRTKPSTSPRVCIRCCNAVVNEADCGSMETCCLQPYEIEV